MGEPDLTPEEQVRDLRNNFVRRRSWWPNSIEWLIGGFIALGLIAAYFVATSSPVPAPQDTGAPKNRPAATAVAKRPDDARTGLERLRIVPGHRIGAVLIGNTEEDNDLNMKTAWPGMQPQRRVYGGAVNWYWVDGLLQAVYVNDKCIGVVARHWDFYTDRGARPLMSFAEWKAKHGAPKTTERDSGELRAAYKGMVLTVERGKVVAVTVRP